MRIITSQSGDTTTICVSDDGPGISPSDRERVFVPFVRLSEDVTEGAAGTGIGLSISKNLAVMHGGDLVIDSSEVGASFRLTLKTPRRDA